MKISENTTTDDLKITLAKVDDNKNKNKHIYNEPALGLCKLTRIIVEHHLSRNK